MRRILLAVACAAGLAVAGCGGGGGGTSSSGGGTTTASSTTTGSSTTSTSTSANGGSTGQSNTSGSGSTTGTSGTTGSGSTGASGSSGSSGSPGQLCDYCTANSDCASGLCDASGYCNVSTCDTTTTAQCTGAGGTCANSACQCPLYNYLCAPCTYDTDCQSGLCDPGSHVCQTTTCSASTDCTDSNGTCAANGSCTCPAPTVYGLCESCSSDADCASGFCDHTNGVCQTTTCGTSTECTDRGYLCGGSATLGDGGAASGTCNCAALPVCNYCSSDADCASGFCDMVNGVCQVSSCSASPGACQNQGYACAPATLGDGGAYYPDAGVVPDGCGCNLGALCDYCGTDADCASGACDPVNHWCLPPSGQSCGQACTNVGGTCVTPDGGGAAYCQCY